MSSFCPVRWVAAPKVAVRGAMINPGFSSGKQSQILGDGAWVPPSQRSVCAIVVTYEPDAAFPDRLELIAAQFPRVLVVDNASIGSHVQNHENILTIRNTTNLGIAEALNIGIALAYQLGYEWVVTFDQDTVINENFLRHMLESTLKFNTKWFLIGANYIDLNRKRVAQHGKCRNGLIRRATLITSGMLISIALVRAIGGFRADFFIDSVDHEFCLRAADQGAASYVTLEPLMQHSIGSPVDGPRWARSLSRAHPPFRQYSIARNVVWTVRLHGVRHPLWALRQFGRLGAKAVSIVFHQQDRSAKLNAFWRGLVEGITAEMIQREN